MDSTRSEHTPLQGDKLNEQRGLRVIQTGFGILMVIVSVALAVEIRWGDNKIPVHGSIVTDNSICTKIGSNFLKNGGNAVDAAIASSICLTVVRPHITSIGGGGFMIIYNQRYEKAVNCLDFRPSRGLNSTIGVPGFIAGLYEAHKLLGKHSWSSIIMPSVDLARNGFFIEDDLVKIARETNTNNTKLKKWLDTLKTGEISKSIELANFLEKIANNGPDEFYKNSMTNELSTLVGNLSLANYNVNSNECLSNVIGKYKFTVPTEGSGGSLLIKLLSYLNDFKYTTNSSVIPLLNALAGTTEFERPFTVGTNVAIMDDRDIYVSLFSGIGSVLGSQIMTDEGYLLNNALDLGPLDIKEKPESLVVPVIISETGQICGNRFVIGGNDARDVAQVLYELLFNNSTKNLQDASEAARVRLSSLIGLEINRFPSLATSDLKLIKEAGYNVAPAPTPYPSINVISKNWDNIKAYADSRGKGLEISF